MTNAELIAKIKAEIERRKKSLIAGICSDAFTRKQKNEMLVASEELDRFNRFLSDLEKSENPMNQDEDLEEEIERIVKCEKEFMNFKYKSQLIGYIARHFAQWGAEHAREQMLKEAVPFYEILEAVPPGPERDNTRIIILKED